MNDPRLVYVSVFVTSDPRLLQRKEDMEFSRRIRDEARKQFTNYLNAPVIEVGGRSIRNHILIVSPLCYGLYHIYDESTARFKNADVREMVVEEFNKLRRTMDY